MVKKPTHEELTQRVKELEKETFGGKRLEEAKTQSADRFRLVFERSNDAIIVHQDRKIKDVNRRACELTGYTREQLLNMLVLDLFSEEYHEAIKDRLKRSVRAGATVFETKWKRADGELIDVEVNSGDFDLEEGIRFGITRDITERKRTEKTLRKSEERFRAIFGQASIGIAEVDTKTGRFIRINQKYCDIAGYSLEEMMAMTYMQITHPDDLQADLDNVRKIGEGEIRIYDREKRYIQKDGAIVWVHLTLSPIWKKIDQSTRHVAVVEDITERKQAEEQRDKLIAELQKALSEVKTLQGFLPICSHCKKIRDDKGYWNQIESYIHKHSDAEFSHGICPECAKKHYPDFNLYDE
ncbi:MAG: PAS domain S-box protein [Desulfobacterales bacterium]|nr:PAS domain S-box protein [Desulfobacterales bacterium]